MPKKNNNKTTLLSKNKKKAIGRSPCAHAYGHFFQSRKIASPLRLCLVTVFIFYFQKLVFKNIKNV